MGDMMEITPDTWEHYRHELNRFIHRRIENPMDAEDLLQDVLIKAYQKQGQLTDGGKLRGWLYQIARHAITDYYRLNRNGQVALDDWSSILMTAIEEPDHEAALLACVSCLIEELPDKYRDPLMASDIHEIPQHVLSQQLGLSYSGLKSRVQRGREKLKQSLESICGAEVSQYRQLTCGSQSSTCNCPI